MLKNMYLKQYIFRMNRVPIAGYRKLRTLSQLFESIPQISYVLYFSHFDICEWCASDLQVIYK